VSYFEVNFFTLGLKGLMAGALLNSVFS